jgi:hypothetical protein
MVINFRTRRISRGIRKLTRTPTLIKKKLKTWCFFFLFVDSNNIHVILQAFPTKENVDDLRLESSPDVL